MSNSVLELRTVKELLSYNFSVPSYQRGYRWKRQQVEDILQDIDEHQGDGGYCLQPLVVKKSGEKYDVIDGQQRLTTIFLILSYLKNEKIFTIEYDKREKSTENLKNKKFDDTNLDIDSFHFKQAYNSIKDWFGNKTEKDKWGVEKLEKAIFIWYETTGDTKDSIEIFRRLNNGKIPLTNSELIRALLIINIKGDNPDVAFMLQSKIGSEWDFIEQQLHNEDFWAFITLNNPFPKKEYPNRIEYIFDLIEQKKKGDAKTDDKYSTFRMYNDWVNGKDCVKKDVQTLWQEVKEYYYRFHEWYIDIKLYNLIGYALIVGFAKCSLPELLDFADSNPQSKLENHIKAQIKEQLFKEKTELVINDICFGDGKVRKILLLFNVSTLSVMGTPKKFDFNLYKSQQWDIEHIRSQTPEQDKDKWLEEVRKYLGEVDNFVSNNESKKNELIKCINEYQCQSNSEKSGVDESIFEEVRSFFGEIDVSQDGERDNQNNDVHGIGNLALLDSKTNRAYKNAVFPIKRKYIVENIKAGEIFVPISTQNVFLKFYSKNISNMLEWTSRDSEDYQNQIINTIEMYLEGE